MFVLFLFYTVSALLGSWLSKYPHRERSIALVYVTGLLFLRPNVLGENYGFLAPAIFLTSSLFASLTQATYTRARPVVRVTFWLVACQLIYIAYMIFQVANLRSDLSMFDLAKNTGSVLVALIVTAYLCQRNLATSLIKMYVSVVFSLSILSLVTTAVISAGVSGCIAIEGSSRGWTYLLCAPGGIYAGPGYYSVLGLSTFDRWTGSGGEPAVFSVEIAIAAVFLLLYPALFASKFRRFALATFLIGLVLTQSITGLVLGTLSIAVIAAVQFKRRAAFKRFVVFAIVAFAASFFTDLSRFKRKSNSLSVNDRFKNLSLSDYVDHWVAYPLGNQFYGFGELNVGVNALGLSLVFGPIVFLFVLFIYFLPPFFFYLDKKLLVPSGILIGCVLFSQPPFENQLWIVLAGLIFITGSAMTLDEVEPKAKASGKINSPSVNTGEIYKL